MPEKPSKKTYAAYDYHECRDYLQQRDGYDERDYAGKWNSPNPQMVPSQDFWHFVCAKEPSMSSNGTFFAMCDWWGDGAEPWQQEILNKYLETFGEYDPHTGERYVEFYVDW